jgi:gliding motility-associated-like protein
MPNWPTDPNLGDCADKFDIFIRRVKRVVLPSKKLSGLFKCLLLITACCWALVNHAQCPQNIGFENGSFDAWKCFSGKIDSRGTITMDPVEPIPELHALLQQSSPQEKDYYGGFPVNCPNGSGFSVRLGDNSAGGKAVGLTYELTVPADQPDFSIVYYYAVVFQNPTDHSPFEQPRFLTRVFNVTDNAYINCSSFEFIADASLPGFAESKQEKQVYYKDWAPVTVRLAGLAGKTIRLEFTVNDCTRNVHFGYAYLDIDETCGAAVTGNNFCSDATEVKLSSPFGYRQYKWYTDDFAQLLGSNRELILTPPPQTNTRYALVITPFANQGCQDTIFTTVKAASAPIVLQTAPVLSGCSSPGVDITSTAVTAGSSGGLSFSYFTDAAATKPFTTPKSVTQTGRYYIKATNSAGCFTVGSVDVTTIPSPDLKVNQPPPACNPSKVDLTLSSVTAGSEPGLSLSYWTDARATRPLSVPNDVSVRGTYYIKAAGTNGCATIAPVQVSFGNPPNAVFRNLEACGAVSLGANNPTIGSDPSIQFSYWTDAAGTQSIPFNHVFTSTTDYYIKAMSPSGCQVLHKANATVFPMPQFTVTPVAAVTIPSVVNLTQLVTQSNQWQYSYWKDSNTTVILNNPQSVTATGTYYIKAVTDKSCTVVKSISVTVNDPVIVPPNAFTPNGDGIHDTWQIPFVQYYPEASVEVFNRDGSSVFRSTGYSIPWDGSKNGKPLLLGTYYYVIRLSSKHQPMTGSVTLLK